ncbi:aspartyl protease family protein [Flavobacteriaceae bacterium F08102]|nr:aspartyl protease family protein [Flavobacteriaceae bacterium F08102]
MRGKIYIVFLYFGMSFSSYSQDVFLLPANTKSQTISFKLINNLIILPVEVNGSNLNFILDTGVDQSLLFNLNVQDSLKLQKIEEIRIRGLGEGDYLSALESTGNTFKLGKITNRNHKIYAITGDEFDLSNRMGIDINGIIGSELFNDFIVEINYSTKRITFNNPSDYVYKDCQDCETFDLDFYQNKPYIIGEVIDHEGRQVRVKLLIDSGGGDALWLFSQSHENIVIPKDNFNDFLGRGLSGNIYGKRGRIKTFRLGGFSFEEPIASYPDSTSITSVYKQPGRNGTLGAEILKRFKPIIDYRNKKITLRKNRRYYNSAFYYNMSGVELMHTGPLLFSERVSNLGIVQMEASSESSSRVSKSSLQFSYVFSFKKSYQIAHIRKDSPAEKAGLQEGDILVKINGRDAKDMRMEEIIHILSTKDGRKIHLIVQRLNEKLNYSFRLQELFGKG